MAVANMYLYIELKIHNKVVINRLIRMIEKQTRAAKVSMLVAD